MKKLLATMLALVMALTLCATAWAEGDTTATVTDWAGLQAALAEGKTTIDLSNGTYSFAAVEGESIAINGKTVTFQNGTFDVSGTKISAKNSFFDITSSNVTFNNVKFTGNDYWSGYAVIYGYQKSTVVLNGCTFELTGENHKDGGILKGEKLDGSDSNFNVTNCTFNLTNTVRVFANTTLTMTNSTVNSVIDKNVDNAFRNLYGTITNSTITVSGHEHGLKNNQNNVLKLVNSTVTLSNSTVKDLLLDSGATVELDINSVLTYSTVNEATVTLTLVLDEGKKTMIPLVKDGSVDLTKYVPTKTGYAFAGWMDAEGKVVTGYGEVNSDTTLTAKWTVKTSNVTINGSETGSATITADQAFTLTETPATSSTTPAASATFNDSAATAIVDDIPDDATGVQLTVTAKAADAAAVEKANQEAYAAAITNTSTTNAVVVSIDLKVGNTKLFTSEVDGAYAIVKVPYKTGMKNITVYYLNGENAEALTLNANLTTTGTFTYDSQTGVITMKLPHFSQYLINAEKASNGAHFKPIHSGGATAADTVKDKAESPKTFDAGIAVYGVMAISSVLGMGYVGKKKF